MDVDEEELYDENDEIYEDGSGKEKFQIRIKIFRNCTHKDPSVVPIRSRNVRK